LDQAARRRYKLLQKIATGGMAEVFLAHLEGSGGFQRRVVIKKILRRWAHNADVLSLFRDEARIGSRLDHHNVVQVLDYGRYGDDTYLVLEYVEGRNLAELISAAADHGHYLPATTAAFTASECCSALDHIHGRTDRTGEHLGVVHRDINPANILISHGGEVKLTDFGVAAGLHRELKTAHGILRGTFPYMSPEQTYCRPVYGRSDIFSVGICLYEALTARHPFAEDEDYLTIKNIQELTPTPPDHLRGDLDPALCAIVARCLEKDPDDRYRSARALQDDLVGWLRARKATYGAGRLGRIMTECFPSTSPPGAPVDPVQITLGPTTPGSANPLLDLSLLDSRKKPRVGGAIEPGASPDDTITTTVEALEDSGEFDAPNAAPDDLGALDGIIRAASVDWSALSGRRADLRSKASHGAALMPRGPVSMDRMKRASAKRTASWVPLLWWVGLFGLVVLLLYVWSTFR
jgi:serine/threonine protein kinase